MAEQFSKNERRWIAITALLVFSAIIYTFIVEPSQKSFNIGDRALETKQDLLKKYKKDISQYDRLRATRQPLGPARLRRWLLMTGRECGARHASCLPQDTRSWNRESRIVTWRRPPAKVPFA